MEKTIYVIQRDDGAYYGKKGDWVSGDSTKEILCRSHRDQALNELVELTLKDVSIRAQVREIVEAEFVSHLL